MYKQRLFIDFDGRYRSIAPPKDTLVLTNLYYSPHTYNISANISIWDKIKEEFDSYINNIDNDALGSIYGDKKTLNVYFFTSFFAHLGQWFSKIEELLAKGIIDKNTEIIFSSYCNNAKVFVFEAEGETNGQFLYKKSYYLSYYIRLFFEQKQCKKIKILKRRTFSAIISFYLRGTVVLLIKTLQILFYKIFVRRRSYLSGDYQRPMLYISSRGLIQTQFVSNICKKYSNRVVMIVNESSSKPFRNLKAASSLGPYYYAEGKITLRQLMSEIGRVVKSYLIKDNLISNFYGVGIDVKNLIPECSIKHFHCRTYAHMVNNSIIEINKNEEIEPRSIISMEMLPPFAYFLKEFAGIEVNQIQTTAMLTLPYPNFVYGNKFYFSNKETFEEYSKLNFSFGDKFDLLDNIKYVGISKKERLHKIDSITYFSQPIFLDEERELIEFLKLFCDYNNLKLKIKFHPRASIPSTGLEKVEILSSTSNSVSIVNSSDLVATRNSSVGQDCWFLNVPVLFFVHGTLKGDNVAYIPKDYSGAIKDNLDIIKISNQLSLIVEDFYTHAMHNNCNLDEENIIKKLFVED